MFHAEVSNVGVAEPVLPEVQIGNVATTVEIDSGVSRSVISESFRRDHLSNYKQKKTEAILRFYDGRIIRPVGQVVVDIVHGHRKIETTLIVVKRGSRPLFALFGEQKGIPQMAAGRLQRWALFLSGLAYKLQYVKGKDNGAADGLPRLPIKVQEGTDESKDYFNFIIEDKIPLHANQIRKELRRDPVLSKVYKFTLEGWPVTVQEEA
ncbi:hypothetical protein KPH14_009892 [Odynerus spinipes]|uniref:Uncharacterized protein n=1 Tax=Odynerus spinipes TaxID=1348599 RepID=A0AAD9RE66_9HYME|nr:hypothetical protein KPH14_009892 [Odynerus spinipes]